MLTEALEAYLRDGQVQRTAVIFLHLGATSGRPDAADLLLRANRLFRDSGNRNWTLSTDLMLGGVYLAAGRMHDARAAWQRARDAITGMPAERAFLPPSSASRLARLSAGLATAPAGISF